MPNETYVRASDVPADWTYVSEWRASQTSNPGNFVRWNGRATFTAFVDNTALCGPSGAVRRFKSFRAAHAAVCAAVETVETVETVEPRRAVRFADSREFPALTPDQTAAEAEFDRTMSGPIVETVDNGEVRFEIRSNASDFTVYDSQTGRIVGTLFRRTTLDNPRKVAPFRFFRVNSELPAVEFWFLRGIDNMARRIAYVTRANRAASPVVEPVEPAAPSPVVENAAPSPVRRLAARSGLLDGASIPGRLIRAVALAIALGAAILSPDRAAARDASEIADAMHRAAATRCTTDSDCDRAARRMGLDPALFEATPAELARQCAAHPAGEACAYIEARHILHKRACAATPEHADCAAFKR